MTVYRGDRVERKADQMVGTVETLVEQWIGLELIMRIVTVEWDNGTISDELDNDVELVKQKESR